MSSVDALLNAKLLDNIQFGFVDQISAKFTQIQHSSLSLLMIIAGIEVVLFGLTYVIKQDEGIGLLIIKIIKISFFFLIINCFPSILQHILELFFKIGYSIAPKESHNFLFSPGMFWDIGFKPAISLLKVSAKYGTFNIGLSLMYLVLGFGLLLIFATIGAQIIIAVTLFYLTSVVCLITIPFGALRIMQDFFCRAIQYLIKSGIYLLTVIIILGVFYSLITPLKGIDVSQQSSLVQPFALFFTSFILMILLYTLPKYVSQAIGKPEIKMPDTTTKSSTQSNVNISQASNTPTASPVSVATSLQSSTSVTPPQVTTNINNTQQASSMNQAVNVKLNTASSLQNSTGLSKGSNSKINDASKINQTRNGNINKTKNK